MIGRFFAILLFFLSLGFFASGQEFFIYVQSENRMPFFIKWQDRAFNSSSSGYVVIPRVGPGYHMLQIGFSGDSWSVRKFRIRMLDKDAGFMLKKNNEDHWILYNLQTTETIEAEGRAGATKVPPRSDDAFVNILADVVNTPSLRQPVTEPIKKDTVRKIKDSGSLAKNISETDSEKKKKADTAVAQNIVYRPPVEVVLPASDTVAPIKAAGADEGQISAEPKKKRRKKQEVRTEVPELSIVQPEPKDIRAPQPAAFIQQADSRLQRKERIMTYYVSDGILTDTVDIVIDYRQRREKDSRKSDTTLPAAAVAVQAAEVTVAPVIEKPAATKPNEEIKKSVSPAVSFIFCKDSASGEDFLKLRKRLAAEDSEDAMLQKARLAFRSKCYTTMQVRNLSFLFLNEEKRYLFFEASYSCVADKVNFGSLENLLSDAVLIKRFRDLYRPKN